MSSVDKKQKIVGTLVPLSALTSIKSQKEDQGTFEVGTAFLDWLKKTNQSAWQVLPLHQTQLEKGSSTRRVPSPYKGYGIGLDPKYLSSSAKAQQPTKEEVVKFGEENSYWIHDYALFAALTSHFGTDDWRKWDEELKNRRKEALSRWSRELKVDIYKHTVIQYQLHRSYKLLKTKAKSMKISLMGDLPFYVSVNSPLVWANQEAFQLKNGGEVERVSGVPHGVNSHFGRQVWGHPLYNWDIEKGKSQALEFWYLRLRYMATLFDSIRIDHIIAFYRYGALNSKSKLKDMYLEGPGSPVLKKVIDYGRKCGLSIYVEDSGKNVKIVNEFLAELKIPGIKLFRFALDELTGMVVRKYADIASYPVDSVAYTTTHDTESLISYIKILTERQRLDLSEASKIPYSSDAFAFAERLRNGVISSPSRTVIVPIQDWLLTTDRINIPGTEKEVDDPNWRYILNVSVEDLPEVTW